MVEPKSSRKPTFILGYLGSHFCWFSYRADDVTGYVADVRYEGEIKPFKPAPPPVVPVPVAKGLAPRPVAKRNENTSEKDFAEQVVVKKTEVKEAPRRHNKKQHNGYYTPQPYHPF